jgi:outer membrane biosynthesis protein TonB
VAEFGTPLPQIARSTSPVERLTGDEFDQVQTTPRPSQPSAPGAAPAGDGHGGKNWPPPPLALPALSGGPLFGNVATLPESLFPVAHAELGLSKLTGLAALVHRHRHLKYVVAATVVVVLVILVILLSWRGEGARVVPAVQERAARAPEVPTLDEVATPPKADTTAEPEAARKGRTAARVASRRPGRHAVPAAKAAVVGEDPFEGPSPSSHRAERPIVPVEAPGQSHRSGSSGGEAKVVSQAQIAEVVRNKEHQSGLKTCYERALRRDGRLRTGRLDITVSVGESGTVQRVQVHGPTDFLIIDGCIKDAIRHWRFPANPEEYATSFPLILQGDSS